jgi:ABC-type multidrug transport system ATPase subunit
MGQKVSLYSGLSLRENVEFYGGLYGLSPAELGRRWDELRKRFSLGASENERAEDLPAGLRQRAGLALAILHAPRLLFLDEPTAGVDVHSRELFWELIQEEARTGVTVFVTTHFLEEAEYCDWVSFIHAGRLIANASPEELRRRYSRGYRIRVDVDAREHPAAFDRLTAGGRAAFERRDGALELDVPTLDAGLLDRLGRLGEEIGPSRVRIDPSPMNEVFRKLLAEAAS